MKGKKKEVQLTFDFGHDDKDAGFTTVRGVCKCGRPWEFRKSGIVMEMTVPCPACHAIIVVKEKKEA